MIRDIADHLYVRRGSQGLGGKNASVSPYYKHVDSKCLES